MKGLMRRLMVAMAVMGLMVWAPAVGLEVEGKNPLDLLEVAKSNLRAAAATVSASSTTLSPEVARDAAGKFNGAATDIQEGEIAWMKIYTEQHAKVSDPPPASTLAKQLSSAESALDAAATIVGRVGEEDHDKGGFKKAEKLLESATSKFADAQKEVIGETSAEDQAAIAGAAIAAATQNAAAQRMTEAAQQQEARKSEALLKMVLSCGAITLALVAITLVLLPVGPVKKLRSSKQAVAKELKSLESRQAELGDEMTELTQRIVDVEGIVKKISYAVQNASNAAQQEVERRKNERGQESWTGVERRTGERRTGGGFVASGAPTQAGERESLQTSAEIGAGTWADENVSEVDGAATVKAAQRARGPVADYNEVRAMKATDRATEFSQLYPKQITMTCANPSARNSAAFTELRFKEDHYGKFQAVEHGKEILLFPELNYDYSTGRKTLEGVFLYPEVESATLKLTQAAALEKRGDEWALTRQGVFQNG